jgi:hypothetical protein
METCEPFSALKSRLVFRRLPPFVRIRPMVITTEHLSPILSIIAGIAILIVPRLLNFIVAIYLIIVGVLGLGVVHL